MLSWLKKLGFARSTVIIHLERLISEGLVLRDKKPGEGRGRPKFLYYLTKTPEIKATFQPSIVPIEFYNLRKACRYEKGGYCKLVKDECSAQNCKIIIKPK